MAGRRLRASSTGAGRVLAPLTACFNSASGDRSDAAAPMTLSAMTHASRLTVSESIKDVCLPKGYRLAVARWHRPIVKAELSSMIAREWRRGRGMARTIGDLWPALRYGPDVGRACSRARATPPRVAAGGETLPPPRLRLHSYSRLGHVHSHRWSGDDGPRSPLSRRRSRLAADHRRPTGRRYARGHGLRSDPHLCEDRRGRALSRQRLRDRTSGWLRAAAPLP